MTDLIMSVAERVFSEGGLAAFLLFLMLVVSNVYHVRRYNREYEANRSNEAQAWQRILEVSNNSNKTLADTNSTLLIIKDRLERN